MQSSKTSNPNKRQDEAPLINIIIGSIWSILVLVLIFINSTEKADNTNSADTFLYFLVIMLSSVGYFLILLPDAERKMKYYFINNEKGKINAWKIIPILLITIFILMNLMSTNLRIPGVTDNIITFSAYFIYAVVPLTLILFMYIIKNSIYKLVMYIAILVWLWWAIEFKGTLGIFPNLIFGYSNFLNLLAFMSLTWGFFIIYDYTIPRSFSRLVSINTFNVILKWLVILFIIIIPAGLLTSFLTINPNNLLDRGLEGALGYLILAIIAVFLVQGIGEEMLFRGFFYQFLTQKLDELEVKIQPYFIYGLFFTLFILIFVTPYIGLADPIKDGLVKDVPVELIYPLIALIYLVIGVGFYLKTQDLMLTMVLWSSMLFGWAHFEDWRYLIFATIAGIGYCQTYRKTNNMYAASFLHMAVDVIWGAIL